jgi:transcriptional/translational regulatory protein YebC/TACO1
LGSQGCVSFLFDEIGQILVEREAGDEDGLMLLTADAGARDFIPMEEGYEIITAPADFNAVREALQDAEISMVSAEITRKPQTWVGLNEPEQLKQMRKMLDILDEEDDVQNVYHNCADEREE